MVHWPLFCISCKTEGTSNFRVWRSAFYEQVAKTKAVLLLTLNQIEEQRAAFEVKLQNETYAPVLTTRTRSSAG